MTAVIAKTNILETKNMRLEQTALMHETQTFPYKVRINLSVVSSDVEAACCRVVLLYHVDARHESGDFDVIIGVLRHQVFAGDVDLCSAGGEVAQKPAFFFDEEGLGHHLQMQQQLTYCIKNLKTHHCVL